MENFLYKYTKCNITTCAATAFFLITIPSKVSISTYVSIIKGRIAISILNKFKAKEILG